MRRCYIWRGDLRAAPQMQVHGNVPGIWRSWRAFLIIARTRAAWCEIGAFNEALLTVIFNIEPVGIFSRLSDKLYRCAFGNSADDRTRTRWARTWTQINLCGRRPVDRSRCAHTGQCNRHDACEQHQSLSDRMSVHKITPFHFETMQSIRQCMPDQLRYY